MNADDIRKQAETMRSTAQPDSPVSNAAVRGFVLGAEYVLAHGDPKCAAVFSSVPTINGHVISAKDTHVVVEGEGEIPQMTAEHALDLMLTILQRCDYDVRYRIIRTLEAFYLSR